MPRLGTDGRREATVYPAGSSTTPRPCKDSVIIVVLLLSACSLFIIKNILFHVSFCQDYKKWNKIITCSHKTRHKLLGLSRRSHWCAQKEWQERRRNRAVYNQDNTGEKEVRWRPNEWSPTNETRYCLSFEWSSRVEANGRRNSNYIEKWREIIERRGWKLQKIRKEWTVKALISRRSA